MTLRTSLILVGAIAALALLQTVAATLLLRDAGESSSFGRAELGPA